MVQVKPPRHPFTLRIVIPASITGTEATIQLKSIKIGMVARAASIYRVSEIVVYRDPDASMRDLVLLEDVLQYLMLPPYLRKKIVPLKKTLRGVGVLPPLRAPPHTVSTKIVPGEYRVGLVVKRRRKLFVDVGLRRLVPLVGEAEAGTIVNIKVSVLGRKIVAVLEEPEFYWGYNVIVEENLLKTLSTEGLIKAPSRRGVPIKEVLGDIAERVRGERMVSIIFGSPYKGLYEIADSEGFNLEDHVDYIVNLIPGQGVETVRTEEAVFAALQTLTLIS